MSSKSSLMQFSGSMISLALVTLGSSCGKPNNASLVLAKSETVLVTDGTWLKQVILASDSSAAGIKSSSKIERLLLVKAHSKGDLLETTEELCDISSYGSKSTKLNFPEAFKKSLPQQSLTYKLHADSGKLLIDAPPLIEVIGAKLSDPSKDALPTKASDPRVVDQDGDEQPGVTVEVSASALLVKLSGKIYLTQRTAMELSGVVEAADTIQGAVKWTIDQQVLGSDSTVLGAVSPKIAPDLNKSKFTMRKVDDHATCETAAAERDQLFQKQDN